MKPCAPRNQSSRTRPSQAGTAWKQKPEAWQQSIPFQTDLCESSTDRVNRSAWCQQQGRGSLASTEEQLAVG